MVARTRGDWSPDKPISYGPPLLGLQKLKPFDLPLAFLDTVPLECGVCIAAIGIWFFLTPSLDHFETLSVFCFGMLLVRTLVLALIVYGAWHLWLYVFRKQGTEFKYNRKWPDKNSNRFTFNNQIYDNMFWTLASGVPIWTCYECYCFGPIQMAMRR